MKRDSLERMTASLVVTLVTVFALGLILIIANLTFQWDIFPPYTEKILYFLLSSMVVVVMAAALVNVMLNLSRLAFFAELIAKKMLQND